MAARDLRLMKRASLERVMAQQEEDLAAAHAETENVRAQLRSLAVSARERVQTLQAELHEEIEGIREHELGTAQWQLGLLAAELCACESASSHAISWESIHKKIHQNRRCRLSLCHWHNLAWKQQKHTALARKCVLAHLSVSGCASAYGPTRAARRPISSSSRGRGATSASVTSPAAAPAAPDMSLGRAFFGYRNVIRRYAAAMAISETVHVYTMSPKSISPTTDVPAA